MPADLPALFSIESLIAFLTLAALEIVLGIDNIVFIAILTAKLPDAMRKRARNVGLFLAMIMRIGLLLAISWIMGLTEPLFSVFEHSFSGRDLILAGGGLFLLAKATFEIHDKLEGPSFEPDTKLAKDQFGKILVQIVLLDAVFSLDSVITAVGMADRIEVMIAAVVVAVGVMMLLASRISSFIERHPTLKILALAFLLMIGLMLVIEGIGQHISKGYVYFAMAFSLFVEVLNIRYRKVIKIKPH